MRIDKIDGWRFFAVFAVIISHLFSRAYGAELSEKIRLEGIGLLGVEVFFFISGLVICSALLREIEKSGRCSIRAFYVRRCFRILPPLWIYLAAISLAANFGLISFDRDEIWIPLLFVSNLGVFFPVHWFVGHTWTLSYEEQFYIFFPVLFLLLYRLKITHLILSALIVFPLLALILYFFHLDTAAGFIRFFDFMLWGVYFALFKDEINQRLSSLSSVMPAFLISIMLMISILPLNKFSIMAEVIVLPPLVSVTVMMTVFRRSWIDRYLGNKSLCYLGRASYGIYLWQQIATAKYQNSGFSFYALMIAGMLFLVIFQYEMIERRLIRVGNNISAALIEKGLAGRSDRIECRTADHVA